MKNNGTILNNGSRRKRAGVSPVISTIIIIAITVVMGLALYSYANSQTSAATKSFTDEATDYINLKNDRFTIVGLAFHTNGNSQQFTAYIFNGGDRELQISKATLSATSLPPEEFCTVDPTGKIQSKSLDTVIFQPCSSSSINFDPSTPTVYYVKIYTSYGAVQSYFQKYGGS